MLKLTTLADGVQWVFQEPIALPPWLTTTTNKVYNTVMSYCVKHISEVLRPKRVYHSRETARHGLADVPARPIGRHRPMWST